MSAPKKLYTLDASNVKATRQGFGKGLLDASEGSKDVFVLTADLEGSTNVTAFKEKYPKRFINVGVAEQVMAGTAAGLASEGFSVVMTSFAVFNPGRNWDFVRAQIALNNLSVVVVGSHAGLATGEDGATHQALEDVALMRSLPTMTVLSPCDFHEAASLTKQAIALKKPVYLRLARQKTPFIFSAHEKFTIGKAKTLVKGSDATLLTTGITCDQALLASELLFKYAKLSVSVVHHGSLKPFDTQSVAGIKHKHIFTFEDHNIVGGLGSCAAETMAECGHRAKLVRIGTTSFGQSGDYASLYKKYGLDAKSVALRICKEMRPTAYASFARKIKTLKL